MKPERDEKCLGCYELNEKRTMTGYRFFCKSLKRYVGDDFKRLPQCKAKGIRRT